MRAFGKLLAAASAALLVGGFAASAQASTTVYPVTASGSSSYPTYNDYYAVDQGAGSDISDWASLSQGTLAFLNMDLGAVYSLVNAYVTDRVTSGGPNNQFYGGNWDFTTQFSLAAFTDATFTTIIGAPLVFNHAFPASPTTPAAFQIVVPVSGLSGQYIQYRVLAANGVNTGLSDIHFSAGVPEPLAWDLMLIGFGGMGAILRRRRAMRLAAV